MKTPVNDAPRAAGARNAVLFSIIVPVFREESEILSCLDRLGKMDRIHEAEIIVVDGDGGSTLSVMTTHPARPVTSITEAGRGVQLNGGARISRGRYLIFLHVDTKLPENALSLVEHALGRFQAGVFSLEIDTDHWFLRLGSWLANLRSRFMKMPYGDQTYFVRRSLFETVGGFQPIPIMEDVAFMRELRRRGVDVALLPEKSVTSSRRWDREGVYRATFRNWGISLLYRLGVPAERLAGVYRSRED